MSSTSLGEYLVRSTHLGEYSVGAAFIPQPVPALTPTLLPPPPFPQNPLTRKHVAVLPHVTRTDYPRSQRPTRRPKRCPHYEIPMGVRLIRGWFPPLTAYPRKWISGSRVVVWPAEYPDLGAELDVGGYRRRLVVREIPQPVGCTAVQCCKGIF